MIEHVVLHRVRPGEYRLDGTPFRLVKNGKGWRIVEDAIDGVWLPPKKYDKTYPLLRDARQALGEYARRMGYTID